MSLSRLWRRGAIIGLGLAALVGCSAVRLGYDQGPQLAHWWLDGYLDFNAEQAPRVKRALGHWFAWHRATQLNDYAALMARAQSEVMSAATPAQVCRWEDELRARLEPALERALPLVAELLPAMTGVQLAHLERRYAKANDDLRKEILQPRAEDRVDGAVDRTVERFESFYGRLDESQRRAVAAGVSASPFDAQAWFDQRVQRQRDVLRTLHPLVAERTEPARALPVLRRLAHRTVSVPAIDATATQARLTQYNCDFAAKIHNTTNEAQRRHARDKFKGWEDDLRHLAGAARPTQIQAASTQ